MANTRKYRALVGESVEFTAEGSKDPDGSIVGYTWDFGDISTASGLTTSHAYPIPGDYITTVLVEDDRGGRATNEGSPLFVKVDRRPFEPTVASPPIAITAVSEPVIEAGKVERFDGKSSYGWILSGGYIQADITMITSWEWFFGDGTRGSGSSTNHTYTQAGTYLATLTVKDKNGRTDTTARTIRVIRPGVKVTGVIKSPDTYVVPADLRITSTLDLSRSEPAFSGGVRPTTLVISDFLSFASKGDIAPKAAGSVSERWEISPDGKTYTFYLRKGVKFWDGTELTAEDVEYSWERNLFLARARNLWGTRDKALLGVSPGSPVSDETIKNAVEAVDRYTVRFNLKFPFAQFIYHLATPSTAWIISKNYAISKGAWNWGDPRDFVKLDGHDIPMDDGVAVMATGPYKPVEWIKGDRMVLQRHEGYWQGPAPLKYIRMVYVAEWSTRRLMLETGEADWIYIRSPAEFEQMIGIPGIVTQVFKYSGFMEYLRFGINFDPTKQPRENLVPPDFFNDVHMRKAFAYAFPYERYAKEIWVGYASTTKSLQPPGWPGEYNSYPYEYDPAKAVEHLKLAHGGKYWNEGFQVAIGYQTWAAGTHGRAYEMLAEEFRKIDPKFKVIPYGTQWSLMLQGTMGMILDWVRPFPSAAAVTNYHSKLGYQRYYKWINPTVEALLDKATEAPTPEEEIRYTIEALKITAEEVPVLYAVFTPEFVAMRDYVKGYYQQLIWMSTPGYFFAISKG